MLLLTTLIAVFYMTIVVKSQIQGELDTGAGYILSWMGDFDANSVTFTIQGPGDGTYILGFSLTKDYYGADLAVAYDIGSDQSTLGYEAYDYYTGLRSTAFIIDARSNEFVNTRMYDAASMTTTVTFTRQIVPDHVQEDTGLDQCVFVIWGYSTSGTTISSLDSADLTIGIFEEQLCGLQATEAETITIGCELLNGAMSLGSIATLGPLDVSLDNELFCTCSNTSVSIEFILPNGDVANNSASIALSSDPGSVGISPTNSSLRLAQGVYTCRVNGRDELHAYILESMGLTRAISNTNCRISSLSPTELILSTQLQGIPPESLVCAEDGNDPETVDDAQIDILDRNPPTTTLVSVPFAPTNDIGRYDCNITSTGGITARFFCDYSISASTPSIPPSPSSAESPQVGVGSTTVTQFSQISVNGITQSSPLWCQGSNSSDEVSWTTPQGEELVAGTISNTFGTVSNPGALGLYPLASTSFPSGIYTCTINGESSNSVEVGLSSSLAAPIINSSDCHLQNESELIISAVVSGGLPETISCSPSTTQTSIVLVTSSAPFMFDVTATFDSITSGQSYTCTATNAAGSSATFTCYVLAIPSSFTASRTEFNSSTVTFSWQSPTSTSISIDGYTLTIFSSDGSVVQTVSITSPTQTTVDVTGLDPDQEFLARISSTSTAPSVSLASDPISVPTAANESTPAPTSQCQPAEGRKINLCLRRPLRNGENRSSCSECSDVGFGNAAFGVVQSNCSLTSGECTSPMIMYSAENCACENYSSGEKTHTRRGKTNTREKTKKGKTGTKEKSKKREKTGGTNGRKDMSSGENYVEVCLEGTLLCGSCEPLAIEDRRRKREVFRRLRLKRKHSSSKSEKSKSSTAKTASRQDCPDVLSVQGTDYIYTELKIDRMSSLFCGNTTATSADSCDCPESCS